MKNVFVISLSLLLLLAVGIEGMVTTVRSNCKCPTASSKNIPLRHVAKFEIFQPGPSCNKLEYIVTRKPSGKLECLDPTSKQVQAMLEKYQALKKAQPRRRRPIRPQ